MSTREYLKEQGYEIKSGTLAEALTTGEINHAEFVEICRVLLETKHGRLLLDKKREEVGR